MTTPRLWPTVQALGRTIVGNRSDIFHQSVRVYNNQNHQVGHAASNFTGHTSNLSSFDDKLRFQHNLLHRGQGSYLKVVSKSFASGVQIFFREFSDGENEHAHDILRSLPAYESTTVDTKSISPSWMNALSKFSYKNEYWPSIGTDELVHTFQCISKLSFPQNLTLDDKQYHWLCISLMERIPYMNDDQLLKVLSSLSQWPLTQNTSPSKFDMLWKALDHSCSQRVTNWDISKIFLVADHWYALRISKTSIYFNKLLNILGINMWNLTPPQLVQYLFYVNLNRDFRYVKRAALEKKIKEVLTFLSIEEIGIIAMALFKTQTSIKSLELLESIIETTVNNLNTISNHSLGSILKLLNKNLPGNAHSQCYDFLETLNPHLNKFNNFVFLQAALFGNNLLVFHEGIMSKIGDRFGKEISVLRLKDLERFTYSLMVYKYIPPEYPNIVNLIVEELRKPERVVEINHFPRCFISCVNYLVQMETFPHDLISGALQPSMVQFFLSTPYGDEMGREINELNWALKIEVPPTYLGHVLDPQISNHLTKRFMGRIPEPGLKGLTHQENLLIDVHGKMEAMMGMKGCVEPVFILPHYFNPDLVFCTTGAGDPVELPQEIKALAVDALKPVEEFKQSGLLWNAVMIGGRNSFIRDTKKLKGNLEVKKRQLVKLGYRVSVVSYLDYLKTSIKYKLICLDKSLKDSSLNLEGRKERAIISLKADSTTQPQNEEENECSKIQCHV